MQPVWSNCSDAGVKISCKKLHKVHNKFPADTHWLPTDAALTPFVPPKEKITEENEQQEVFLQVKEVLARYGILYPCQHDCERRVMLEV